MIPVFKHTTVLPELACAHEASIAEGGSGGKWVDWKEVFPERTWYASEPTVETRKEAVVRLPRTRPPDDKKPLADEHLSSKPQAKSESDTGLEQVQSDTASRRSSKNVYSQSTPAVHLKGASSCTTESNEPSKAMVAKAEAEQRAKDKEKENNPRNFSKKDTKGFLPTKEVKNVPSKYDLFR